MTFFTPVLRYESHEPLCEWPEGYVDPIGMIFPDWHVKGDHPWHLEPIEDEV